jgi:hypothetical protein
VLGKTVSREGGLTPKNCETKTSPATMIAAIIINPEYCCNAAVIVDD